MTSVLSLVLICIYDVFVAVFDILTAISHAFQSVYRAGAALSACTYVDKSIYQYIQTLNLVFNLVA